MARARRPVSAPKSTQPAAQDDEAAVVREPPQRTWREENPKLFGATVRAAADQLRVQPLAVEKDYWVCRALRAINDHAPGEIVFKGGTSLEKLRIIQRFSEDLDLLVVGNYPSGNAAKNALKRMCAAGGTALSGAVEQDSLSGGNAGTYWRKAYLRLPLEEAPTGRAIADPGAILIELGQTGGRHPSQAHAVTSLLGRQLAAAGQQVDEFADLEPFEVEILHPGRTLIEKLLRVNNFAADEARRRDRDGWPRIGRQFYDIWALLHNDSVQEMLDDRDTSTSVMRDCMRISLAFNPDLPPPTGGFAASPAFDSSWQHSQLLRGEHERAMAELYYGTAPPPSFEEVLAAVADSASVLDLES